MKKLFIVLFSFTVSCHILFGADTFGTGLLPESRSVEGEQQNVTVSDTTKIQYGDLSLKEKILYYFEDEAEREVFKGYIQDDSIISQGIAAKILCEYCGLSPMYLPQKEGCSNPYIGRLFLEYIWGNYSYDENKPITLEQWDHLYSAAKQFKSDEHYVEKAMQTDADHLKQKINDYKKMLQQDNSFQKITVGPINKSASKLNVDDESYDLYQFLNTTYIRLSTLESMGFEKQVHNNREIRLLWHEKAAESQKESALKTKNIMINNQSIYIGPIKTYSLSVGDETLVPIRALEIYFDISSADNQIYLSDKYLYVDEIVSCDDDYIYNHTSNPIKISYTDLYWDGSKMIEYQSEPIQIEGSSKYSKTTKLYALCGGKYLTTLIHTIETDNTMIQFNGSLGQNNELLLKKYNEAFTRIMLENEKKKEQQKEQNKPLFPASIITGTMKYSTNGFAKGQKVEVWAAEDKVVYYVKDNQNKTVKIPWNSISIPSNPPTSHDKPTKEQIETFINDQNISSKTAYLVWTDLYRQQTYVFKGKKNDWHLIKIILSSSGKNKTPTPRGLFELTNKVPYFGVDKGYRCKNAFQIFGDYLYHSIIFDKTGTRLLEGTGVLGRRASHGCIRFSEADSLWFYNTLEVHSAVWIN